MIQANIYFTYDSPTPDRSNVIDVFCMLEECSIILTRFDMTSSRNECIRIQLATYWNVGLLCSDYLGEAWIRPHYYEYKYTRE